MSYLKARWSVLKNRNLALHLAGCFLTTLGGGMTHITMMWMVLEKDNSIAAAASLMACYWLPCVILAPLVGVITDRFERKNLLVATNLMRTICFTLIAIMFVYTQSLVVLFLLALTQGLANALHMPVTMSLVREITSPKDLFYANATLDMAYEVGFMIGMTAGGAGVALLSNSETLLINGLCFFLAMLTAVFMVVPRRREVNSQKTTLATFFEDSREGFQYLRKRPHLAKIYSLQTVLMVCYMTAPILLAPFVKGVLKGEASDLGIIEAAFSLGMIIGTFITPYLARRWNENLIFIQLTVGLLISYLLFMFCNTTVQACFIYIFIGFCLSNWALCMTRAQNHTDKDFQGRLQSTFNAVTGFTILAVYFMVSVLSWWIPIQFAYGAQALFALAALILVCAITRPSTDPI